MPPVGFTVPYFSGLYHDIAFWASNIAFEVSIIESHSSKLFIFLLRSSLLEKGREGEEGEIWVRTVRRRLDRTFADKSRQKSSADHFSWIAVTVGFMCLLHHQISKKFFLRYNDFKNVPLH